MIEGHERSHRRERPRRAACGVNWFTSPNIADVAVPVSARGWRAPACVRWSSRRCWSKARCSACWSRARRDRERLQQRRMRIPAPGQRTHRARRAPGAAVHRPAAGLRRPAPDSQQQVMQQERLRALGQMASGIAHDINNAISPVALYTEALLEREPNLSRSRPLATRDHPARGRRRRADRGAHGRVLSPARAAAHADARRSQQARRPGHRSHARALERHGAAARRGHRHAPRTRRRAAADRRGREPDPRRARQPRLQRRRCHARGRPAHHPHRASPAGSRAQIVLLEVQDAGVGMDEDTRRRCLEPFFTTKGTRGTGLGLAMVYGVAQRHGASLEIESEPGKGTLVRMTFAIAPVASRGRRAASHAPARRADAHPHHRRRSAAAEIAARRAREPTATKSPPRTAARRASTRSSNRTPKAGRFPWSSPISACRTSTAARWPRRSRPACPRRWCSCSRAGAAGWSPRATCRRASTRC